MVINHRVTFMTGNVWLLKAKCWVKKIVNLYVKMTEKTFETKKYMTVSCFAQPVFYRTLYK